MLRRQLKSPITLSLFSRNAVLTSPLLNHTAFIQTALHSSSSSEKPPLLTPSTSTQETEHYLTPEERDTLPSALIDTLSLLNKDGLKLEHLANWKQDTFGYAHQLALITLIRKQHRVPEYAVKEIESLNEDQARGIAGGLTREAVLGLGFWQVDALLAFTDTPKGLGREDIMGLSYWALDTLKKLKQDGLRGEHMRYWNDKPFDYAHQVTLFSLIRSHHLSVENAIAEMKAYPLLPLLHERFLQNEPQRLSLFFQKIERNKEEDVLEQPCKHSVKFEDVSMEFEAEANRAR